MAPRSNEPDSAAPPPSFPEAPPDEAVLDSALRLLSARGRSVGELRERLLRKDLEPSAVSYCLRWLESRGYLDDRAFAAALTRERLRFSPRSPFLIERELRNKKVRGPLAHEVVESVMEEEGRTASDLARTAAGHWVRKQNATVRGHLVGERFSPEREKARRRLYGFLARRGFVGEAIRAGMDAGEEEARETKD